LWNLHLHGRAEALSFQWYPSLGAVGVAVAAAPVPLGATALPICTYQQTSDKKGGKGGIVREIIIVVMVTQISTIL
jgi:hypothetical protein